MCILKKIRNFLFGKPPQIFDSNNQVCHNFPKSKWDSWQARYIQGGEYNWRSHNGQKRSATSKSPH